MAVEHWYRHRTAVENVFRDVKLGAALRHLPSDHPQVNTAWMWGGLLAVTSRTGYTSSPPPPDPQAGWPVTVSATAKP